MSLGHYAWCKDLCLGVVNGICELKEAQDQISGTKTLEIRKS